MKRRDMLKLYAGSAVMGGMGMAAAPAKAAALPGDAGYAWSLAGAKALVGQQFWLNHPELRAVPLKLLRVVQPAAQPGKQPDSAMQQFSLVFQGAALLAVAEGTYELQNARTGTFMLHLAPQPRVNGLSNFRADFNLLTAARA